jgi:DNA-binding FadR family transcriptional regulator
MFAAIHKTLMQLIKHNAQCEEYRKKVARHRQIYSAIRRHDADLAAQRMRSHLEDSLEMFVRLAGEQAEQARRDAFRKSRIRVSGASASLIHPARG